jgi:hypothetical protein
MTESTTTEHLSPCASLAAIGAIIQQRHLFDAIRDQVQIAQKTVTHSPADKLYDAFIVMLAGAQGLVEITTRLRADPALQRAFGLRRVPNSRWFRRRSMLRPPRTFVNSKRPWPPSISATARATDTTTQPPGSCSMSI